MANHLHIRTRERDTPDPSPTPIRGVRFWNVAEVPGDVWYMVEATEQTDSGRSNIRRFITTDIVDALALTNGYPEPPSLHAFIRHPKAFFTGAMFEKVLEVHEVGTGGGTLLIRFVTGLMVCIAEGAVSAVLPGEVCRRLYSWSPSAQHAL